MSVPRPAKARGNLPEGWAWAPGKTPGWAGPGRLARRNRADLQWGRSSRRAQVPLVIARRSRDWRLSRWCWRSRVLEHRQGSRVNGRVPRYHRIAETLRGRIRDGEWTAGAPLPNQRRLARDFGVTLMTLRQAL